MFEGNDPVGAVHEIGKYSIQPHWGKVKMLCSCVRIFFFRQHKIKEMNVERPGGVLGRCDIG